MLNLTASSHYMRQCFQSTLLFNILNAFNISNMINSEFSRLNDVLNHPKTMCWYSRKKREKELVTYNVYLVIILYSIRTKFIAIGYFFFVFYDEKPSALKLNVIFPHIEYCEGTWNLQQNKYKILLFSMSWIKRPHIQIFF